MKSTSYNPLQIKQLLCATVILGSASSVLAADGTWITDLGTSPWTTTTNWAGDIVADGAGSTAFFTNDISADNEVTLSAPQTIGNIVFDDAGATGDSAWTISGSTLTLAGTTPTITTHTNATISSILAGNQGLTKAGDGILTLSGANNYTGGTTVSAGTLRVNAQSYPKNGSNRTSLGAMSVASGATLDLINTGAANSYGSPGVIVLRDLTLSGTGTVVTGGTGVTDFWDGDNAVNLTAFTGTFHAKSGTMAFQIKANRMSGVNAMIVDSGAFLDLRTDHLAADGGLVLSSLTGAGKVGSSWSANQLLVVGATNASSQFDGIIQNTVPGSSNTPTIALKKIGTGTLTLTGANTYTGGTTVSAGTLIQDLSARSGNIVMNAITVDSGAVIELKSGTNTGADSTYLTSTTFTGTGTIRKTGTGYLGLALTNANLNAFDGTFDVQAGTIAVNNGTQGSGKATVGLNVSGTKLDIRTGTFLIDALNGVVGSQVYVSHTAGATLSLGNNNGSGTFSGTIDNVGSALALIKNGTGTQTLSGSNTYTGGLNVNGGTLNYTGAGSVTGGGGAVNIASGATLNLSGAGNNQLEATGVLTIAGTLAVTTNSANTLRGTSIVLNGGTMTSSGGNGGQAATYGAFFTGDKNMTVTANGTVNFISGNGDFGIQNGRTLTLATPLLADGLTVSTAFKGVGGTAGALTKTGLGTVTLSGSNTYTGLTNVNAGTLQAGHNSAFGSGAVNVNNGGTLEVKGRSIANAINLVTGGTVKVDSDNTGNGSVGTITATGGTFDSGSDASQNFNLNGNSTFNHLSGQGTFTGGMVSIVNSHNPGNSPGTQTFESGLAYGNNSSLTLEIAADGLTFDFIDVTGGLTIGSNVALTLNLFGAANYTDSFWDSNQTFTLISTDSKSGDFLTPTNNLGGAGEGSWTYGWDGNNYKANWTAVPEPTTALLGSIGVLFLLRRRRA